MLDVLITGGTIIDGTGRPGSVGDVGIRGGRIVSVTAPGGIKESATRMIDATGLVVCPGFIDVHTHYDAQAFWDTTLSPSPLHGVTSVFGGNCGFSVAPLTGDPGDSEYLMRMLARVEGMPLESLEAGVPWDWRSTADYLDRLDGTLTPNAGFMVGHSALRRVVMHDDANQRAATREEIEKMKALLADGLAAGGMGFSSTWSVSHTDHVGVPVPSRHSTREEILELCQVVSRFPGTTLEMIPGLVPFGEREFEIMAAMSHAANRPLNWNVMVVHARNKDDTDYALTASDFARERGGKVVALTLPDSFRSRLTFKAGFVLDMLPEWSGPMTLPDPDKLALLRDPVGRAQLDRNAQTQTGNRRATAHWAAYQIVEAFSPATKRFEGRTVGEVATERGATPWDTLCDIVVEDKLNTAITKPDPFQDDVSWARRVEAWRDPRTLVGASDAGAHLDMIDSFSFATTTLGRAVRERGLLPMEEAIHYLTGEPAALYGLKDRGRIAEGAIADVVVLDPTRIGPGPLQTRFDLPKGAGRLYGEAEGIEHVFINGVSAVEGKNFTEARPGRILRSGRDTETVSVR